MKRGLVVGYISVILKKKNLFTHMKVYAEHELLSYGYIGKFYKDPV